MPSSLPLIHRQQPHKCPIHQTCKCLKTLAIVPSALKETKATTCSPSLRTWSGQCHTCSKGLSHPALHFCCGHCRIPAAPRSFEACQLQGPGSWGRQHSLLSLRLQELGAVSELRLALVGMTMLNKPSLWSNCDGKAPFL